MLCAVCCVCAYPSLCVVEEARCPLPSPTHTYPLPPPPLHLPPVPPPHTHSLTLALGLRPGDVLQGKYTVLEELGSGSNATTYRVRGGGDLLGERGGGDLQGEGGGRSSGRVRVRGGGLSG